MCILEIYQPMLTLDLYRYKKLFALVLGFLTKFFRFHIRGLFEYIGKMRLIEESAFLRYKRYRFVR